MLLAQHYGLIAAKNPLRPAFRYLGKETNHRDLRDKIGRLSYLYQNEIGPKARVVFMTRNAPAFVFTFFALTNIRSLIIPVDPDLPPEELISWIKASKATHLAVTDDVLGRAREILQAGHLSLKIVEIERKHGGEYDPVYSAPPDQQALETDPVLLMRTAGSMGEPKFVALNHKQLHHAASYLRGLYSFGANDRIHTTLSWAHPFAFIHGMLMPLLTGTTFVIDHGEEGLGLLKFLIEAQVTRLIGTPSFFLRLLLHCKKEKQPLPKLRSVTVGLGPLHPEVSKAFHLLKIYVAECYGQTENGWTIAMTKIPPSEPPMKDGDPLPPITGIPGLKYKVLNVNGDEIVGSESRTGHLAVTGPSVMTGYPDREKETKTVLRGTWLYTGDIVTLDGDAGDELRIKYLGRKEDMLEYNGQYFSMRSINAALRTMPGVEDCAAFITKNSRGDTEVACAVVKTPKVLMSDKAVVAHLGSKNVPMSCIPKAVAFTDVIPRDAGGNVLGDRLRKIFSGILG